MIARRRALVDGSARWICRAPQEAARITTAFRGDGRTGTDPPRFGSRLLPRDYEPLRPCASVAAPPCGVPRPSPIKWSSGAPPTGGRPGRVIPIEPQPGRSGHQPETFSDRLHNYRRPYAVGSAEASSRSLLSPLNKVREPRFPAPHASQTARMPESAATASLNSRNFRSAAGEDRVGVSSSRS